MAGHWPSCFFFACLWIERESSSLNSQKSQYSAILTEQAWSMKDLLYGFRGNFSYGIKRVVSRSILPARVANNSAAFGASCPLAELAI